MSILPEIPSNLLTSSETSRVVSQFNTITEQNLVGVTPTELETVNADAALAAADQTIEAQLTRINAAKQKVLDKLFPETLFTSVPLELIESKLNVNIAKYELAINLLLKLPVTSKLVEDLVSPAEIKEYISDKIEVIKRKRQEAIIKLQKQKAKLEETPFTARTELENNQL
jgi:hypothetical protein